MEACFWRNAPQWCAWQNNKNIIHTQQQQQQTNSTAYSIVVTRYLLVRERFLLLLFTSNLSKLKWHISDLTHVKGHVDICYRWYRWLCCWQAWSTKRKGVVQSFLKRHLPAKRLLADQDNISHSQVPLVNPSHKKRFNLTKQRRKKLSSKECKGMKVFKIPKENQRYHIVTFLALSNSNTVFCYFLYRTLMGINDALASHQQWQNRLLTNVFWIPN